MILLGARQAAQEERLHLEDPTPWYFWSVDWHPHKDQFVVGGSNDTFFKLLSSTDYTELESYPYQGTITQTKWHPTQNKLAISVQDGKSKSIIVDLDHHKRIELDTITNDGARAIGWNHSGDLLAVGDYEGFLTIFDQEGHVLKRVQTHQKGIIGLDWHPSENLIVAVGEKITLYHYSLDRIEHIDSRDEENRTVLMLSVAWHPNGTFFVTGDYGDFQYHYPPLLQYWSYEGKRIKAIADSKAELRSMAWSSDGELLATASDKVRLWDKEGELVAEASPQSLLQGIDWSEDDSQLVATDDQKRIILWDRKLSLLKEWQY